MHIIYLQKTEIYGEGNMWSITERYERSKGLMLIIINTHSITTKENYLYEQFDFIVRVFIVI